MADQFSDSEYDLAASVDSTPPPYRYPLRSHGGLPASGPGHSSAAPAFRGGLGGGRGRGNGRVVSVGPGGIMSPRDPSPFSSVSEAQPPGQDAEVAGEELGSVLDEDAASAMLPEMDPGAVDAARGFWNSPVAPHAREHAEAAPPSQEPQEPAARTSQPEEAQEAAKGHAPFERGEPAEATLPPQEPQPAALPANKEVQDASFLRVQETQGAVRTSQEALLEAVFVKGAEDGTTLAEVAQEAASKRVQDEAQAALRAENLRLEAELRAYRATEDIRKDLEHRLQMTETGLSALQQDKATQDRKAAVQHTWASVRETHTSGSSYGTRSLAPLANPSTSPRQASPPGLPKASDFNFGDLAPLSGPGAGDTVARVLSALSRHQCGAILALTNFLEADTDTDLPSALNFASLETGTRAVISLDSFVAVKVVEGHRVSVLPNALLGDSDAHRMAFLKCVRAHGPFTAEHTDESVLTWICALSSFVYEMFQKAAKDSKELRTALITSQSSHLAGVLMVWHLLRSSPTSASGKYGRALEQVYEAVKFELAYDSSTLYSVYSTLQDALHRLHQAAVDEGLGRDSVKCVLPTLVPLIRQNLDRHQALTTDGSTPDQRAILNKLLDTVRSSPGSGPPPLGNFLKALHKHADEVALQEAARALATKPKVPAQTALEKRVGYLLRVVGKGSKSAVSALCAARSVNPLVVAPSRARRPHGESVLTGAHGVQETAFESAPKRDTVPTAPTPAATPRAASPGSALLAGPHQAPGTPRGRSPQPMHRNDRTPSSDYKHGRSYRDERPSASTGSAPRRERYDSGRSPHHRAYSRSPHRDGGACHSCGREGHYARDCPDKEDRYARDHYGASRSRAHSGDRRRGSWNDSRGRSPHRVRDRSPSRGSRSGSREAHGRGFRHSPAPPRKGQSPRSTWRGDHRASDGHKSYMGASHVGADVDYFGDVGLPSGIDEQVPRPSPRAQAQARPGASALLLQQSARAASSTAQGNAPRAYMAAVTCPPTPSPTPAPIPTPPPIPTPTPSPTSNRSPDPPPPPVPNPLLTTLPVQEVQEHDSARLAGVLRSAALAGDAPTLGRNHAVTSSPESSTSTSPSLPPSLIDADPPILMDSGATFSEPIPHADRRPTPPQRDGGFGLILNVFAYMWLITIAVMHGALDVVSSVLGRCVGVLFDVARVFHQRQGFSFALTSFMVFVVFSVLMQSTFAEAVYFNSSCNVTSLITDSGASRTMCSDSRAFINRRTITPVTIKGISGSVKVDTVGDVRFTVQNECGMPVNLTICDVYYNPKSHLNLISVGDLNKSGWHVRYDIGDPHFCHRTSGARVPLKVCDDGLFHLRRWLPVPGAAPLTGHAFSSVPNAGPAQPTSSPRLAMPTHADTLHRRFHCGKEKMRNLCATFECFSRLKIKSSAFGRHKCRECSDANAHKLPSLGPSRTVYTSDRQTWSMDMFDLGDQCISYDGHRYVFIFVMLYSRFTITVTTARKSDALAAFKKAASQVGFLPQRLRSDNAGEFDDAPFTAFCDDRDVPIFREWANPHQQQQNAMSEVVVHKLSEKMRVFLHQSGLGHEFWPYALAYAVSILNHLPHKSLDNQVPILLHGARPYPQMFRVFGCRATVEQGKKLVDHGKLTCRGVAGIFVGIGIDTGGKKGWAVWVPEKKRIMTSSNVTFDEHFFPLRTFDQRWYPDFSEQFLQPQPTTSATSLDPAPSPLPPPVSPGDLLEYDNVSSFDQPSAGISPPTRLPETSASSAGAAAAMPSALRRAPTSSVSSAGATHASSVRFSTDSAIPEGPVNRTVHHEWQAVGASSILDVNDTKLAEFCIGESCQVRFPPNTWPGHPDEYFGQAVATRKDKKGLKVKVACFLDDSETPIEYCWLWVTRPKNNTHERVTWREALLQTHPHMKCLWDSSAHMQSQRKVTRNVPGFRSKVLSALTCLGGNITSSSYSNNRYLRAAHKCSPVLAYTILATLSHFSSVEGVSLHSLPPEPKTYRDSLRRPDRPAWEAGERVEMQTLQNHNTWTVVDCPLDHHLVPTKWVYKAKCDRDGNVIRNKCRVVVRGDLQTPDEYDEVYSPTARMASTRTVISLAVQEGLYLSAWDVEAAFVSSDVDREILIQLPPGYELPPGKAARLNKSLYGLRQASHLYHAKLHRWLTDYGFKQAGDDPTLFRYDKDGEVLILSVYVDDGVTAYSSPRLYARFLEDFQSVFTVSDQGPLSHYLGVSIDYDRAAGTAFLSQGAYVNTLLERFNMSGANGIDTPFAPHEHLTGDDCCAASDPANKQTIKLYQQMVGALLYLAGCTRPDIAFAVNQCARFMSCPGPSHIVAVKRIFRYLKANPDFGIRYRRQSDPALANVLWGYVDADHAGNPEDRRSVTGFFLFLNGGPIAWCSKRQPCVALSSSEAEYYAASLAGIEVLYTRRLLHYLGFRQRAATSLLEDNQACIYMSVAPGLFKRAKHIDTRVHKLRELCSDGVLTLVKVATQDQVADVLTKGLPSSSFRDLRALYMARAADR